MTSPFPVEEFAQSFTLDLPHGWEDQLPDSLPTTDEERMQLVLQLTHWSINNGYGGPFGAAVFDRDSGELISIGLNRVVPASCSLAHAEAVALSLAQQRLKTFDLSRAGAGRYSLFATGQPCVQCFGMTWWSGVTRLVVGARSADIEELTRFQEGPLPRDWQTLMANRQGQPPIEVTMDVCRTSARDLLQHYTSSGGLNYGPADE